MGIRRHYWCFVELDDHKYNILGIGCLSFYDSIQCRNLFLDKMVWRQKTDKFAEIILILFMYYTIIDRKERYKNYIFEKLEQEIL